MADRNEIDAALKQIATALTASIQAALVELKLGDTALEKSIESEVSNGDTVTAYMIEYGRYVISGRRKFARKVPVAALIDWIARKGIKSDNPKISVNSLAFAIQNAIYKNGIAGRDFITPAVDDDFMALAEIFIVDALAAELDRSLATATA